MRISLSVVLSSLMLVSCFHSHPAVEKQKLSIVKRFYGQAMIRAAGSRSSHDIDLRGLQVQSGTLPGMKRYPHWDESSVLVFSTDPADRAAVQIVLSPRIEGPSPDDSELSAENLKEIQAAREEAVQRSRYVSVELGTLPDGVAIKPAGSNPSNP